MKTESQTEQIMKNLSLSVPLVHKVVPKLCLFFFSLGHKDQTAVIIFVSRNFTFNKAFMMMVYLEDLNVGIG